MHQLSKSRVAWRRTPNGRLVYTRLQRLHRHGPSPEYQLGLYATPDYEIDYGTPESIEGLAEHSLIFYVESLLRVEDLDLLTRITGDHQVAFGSTSVQVQMAATLAGAGIGLLPAFVDDREPMLHRVLPAEVAPVLEFTAWPQAVAPASRRDRAPGNPRNGRRTPPRADAGMVS
jgi:DNA-binding transcriptional LysR family regulator